MGPAEACLQGSAIRTLLWIHPATYLGYLSVSSQSSVSVITQPSVCQSASATYKGQLTPKLSQTTLKFIITSLHRCVSNLPLNKVFTFDVISESSPCIFVSDSIFVDTVNYYLHLIQQMASGIGVHFPFIEWDWFHWIVHNHPACKLLNLIGLKDWRRIIPLTYYSDPIQ